MTDGGFAETYLAILLVLLLVSLLPVFIAFGRGHPNRWLIFIVTIGLGATVIGWLVALVWSLHGFHRDKATGSHGGASGLNLFADDVRSIRIVDAGAGDASRPRFTKQDPASPSREMHQLDAVLPGLTIREASALIERLHGLRDRGDISETEAVALKNGVLDRVR